MEIEDIKTRADLAKYIKLYEADIYVRRPPAAHHPSWNWNLNELPPAERKKIVSRWLDEGRVPVRVIREAK